MATEPRPAGIAGPLEVDIEAEADQHRDLDVSSLGGDTDVRTSTADEDTSVEIGGPGAADDENSKKDLEVDAEGGDEEKPTDEGDEGEKPAEEEGALPDFDPDNAEVVEAYDKTFLTEDGKFDMAKLSAEFWAGYGDGSDPSKGLKPDTVKWLEARGIPEDTYREVVAGRLAVRAQEEAAFYSVTGGKERYEAALAWAKGEGGYTEAQRAEFNRLHAAGGQAFTDAAELLATRFGKAMGSGRGQRRNGPPDGRRASSPPRDATARASGGGGGAGGDTFSTQKDYQEAYTEQNRVVRRTRQGTPEHKAAMKALDAISAKGRRSNFDRNRGR